MLNLEKKFGKYAVRNLTMVLISCYAAGYFLYYTNSAVLNLITLNPYEILRGQIWRLVTWVLVPPETSNFLFVAIMLYFYYSIGNTLERHWGSYRYNVYIFSGMLFTVIGAFLVLGVTKYLHPNAGAADYAYLATFFSTYYINMSIFLAFAATFPDVTVLFMFFIPVKMKWLGIIDAVMLTMAFAEGRYYVRIAILASILNFIIFLLGSRRWNRISPGEIKRRNDFKKSVQAGERMMPYGSRNGHKKGNAPIHRCSICGRTELDDPNLEFRFCSKCEGSHEYCQDHLFTHVHVKEGVSSEAVQQTENTDGK